MIGWKELAKGGRKIASVGFHLNTRDLPKVALEQFLLMIDLRVAALRCVWPSSRIQARWGGRAAITMAHGFAPHMSWLEPGGSALLGVLAREATVAGDLGFMRNLIEDIDALRNWSRTKPDRMSAANQRRIEAVNWAFHEIQQGRWFSKAELSEHLDRAGLGTDAGNLARDIFKLPGMNQTPKQPRRR
jgi:hypothetical protein